MHVDEFIVSHDMKSRYANNDYITLILLGDYPRVNCDCVSVDNAQILDCFPDSTVFTQMTSENEEWRL